MAGQMKTFIDQTGGLWMKGALVGKRAASFPPPPPSMAARRPPSPASTRCCCITAWWSSVFPYACQDQMGVEEVKGGSPYGATTIAGGDGSRQPSEKELGMARWQGEHVAKIAKKLSA